MPLQTALEISPLTSTSKLPKFLLKFNFPGRTSPTNGYAETHILSAYGSHSILSAHFSELTKSERVKRSVFRVFEHLGALYPLEFCHQYTTDTHLCTASILISPGHADMGWAIRNSTYPHVPGISCILSVIKKHWRF